MFLLKKSEKLNFDLTAQNSPSGRLYKTPSGEKYPSVTTILSTYGKKELFEWRERVGVEEANRVAAKASRRGTALHTVCEKYLLNELTGMKIASMIPSTKELFFKMKSQLDENITTVYCLEQALYSDRMRIAGRVDCIAEWNGKISVVDFKSSTNQKKKEKIGNYFMQCTAYALMYEEIVGVPIDQIVVLIGTENGPGQVFVEKKDEYIAELEKYVRKHHDK